MKLQALLVGLVAVLFSSCSDPKQQLIIFHAGSLTNPINQISREYEKLNPGVVIKTEAGGSIFSIRKLTELNRTCDILMVSDYILLSIFLDSLTANQIIVFATNSMTVAYTNQSKYADEINNNNWHEILLRPDVKIGRSNPSQDPCGYRTELLFKLAEDYYKKPGLSRKFLNKSATTFRPKETDLLPLLQSGELDYIFIYSSNALRNNLEVIQLPDSINMRRLDLSKYYNNFSTKIPGSKLKDSIEIPAQYIAYGLTVPNNSPNSELAHDFIKFMISQDSIWMANYQSLLPNPILMKN
ncbi:MAG TPA: extracellular solute-binding protein [Salinivirgaceae bacterium]|nr:extracellular solute-binding protein [Salinivirgaceae bacterium]